MSQRAGKKQKTTSKSTPGASSSQGPSATPPPPPPGQAYQVVFATRKQRVKYVQLERRDIRPTLFYDKLTCEGLGIDSDIQNLARTLGLGQFLDAEIPNSAVSPDPDFNMPPLPPRTYRELTLEFLSSFERQITSEEGEDVAFTVQFRIFNRLHNLSDDEFNELFGWSTEAKNVDFSGAGSQDYSEVQWWKDISLGGDEYQSNKAKASDIMHASLRYFHRMLVYIFFSRQDVGKTSNTELYLLWRAVGDNEIPTRDELNLSFLLAKRFQEITNKPGMTGSICIGGIVTWIAYKLGYSDRLRHLVPISDEPRLELNHLITMKMVRQVSEYDPPNYIWLVRDIPWCYMPSTFMTNPPDEVENPWKVPMGRIADEHLSRRDKEARLAISQEGEAAPSPPPSPPPPQQQVPPQPVPLQTFQRRPRPSPEEAGMTTSLVSLENAFANLALHVERLQAPPPSIYESNIYDYHVDQGHFAPYVNYPYHPPQHGPVPSWATTVIDDEGNEVTRSQLCYPYWQGPGTQYNRPRDFPPYDYREPGGCDYRGDPNYPGPPGFPSGYTGGWEPHGPPVDVDYDWNPPPPPQ